MDVLVGGGSPLGDSAGGIHVAKGSPERPSVIAWLSYNELIRWSPRG